MNHPQNKTVNAQSNLIHITDKEFATLTKYVKTKYGIDLTKKRVLIEGRLTQELHRRGFTTFQQYIDVVFQDQSGNVLCDYAGERPDDRSLKVTGLR